MVLQQRLSKICLFPGKKCAKTLNIYTTVILTNLDMPEHNSLYPAKIGVPLSLLLNPYAHAKNHRYPFFKFMIS